jgi:hypothetical protein
LPKQNRLRALVQRGHESGHDQVDTRRTAKGKTMSLGTILLILIILMLIGALPTWPHSRSWGYYPSGGLGLVLVILIILLLLGVI